MHARLAAPFLVLLTLAAGSQEPREVELTYLANEGFLIRSGTTKVLIDAFVSEPYSMYAAVPEETFAAMVDGQPPFDGVDLALASHVHADHFQLEAAAAYLGARTEVAFLSSPQVVGRLEIQDAERIAALLPPDRKTREAQRGGVEVEFLRLPHDGGERVRTVQNLGHLIEIGGVRLLHVGDAGMSSDDLESYGLAARGIDVALVPYWWLSDSEALAEVKKRVGDGRIVAMHVPPAEVKAEATRLAALDPEILCFEASGEARTLTFEATDAR
jgi:L-ascorbate metabolism protein UlaG (beta-lactamase superfamily)